LQRNKTIEFFVCGGNCAVKAAAPTCKSRVWEQPKILCFHPSAAVIEAKHHSHFEQQAGALATALSLPRWALRQHMQCPEMVAILPCATFRPVWLQKPSSEYRENVFLDVKRHWRGR
jgi:hypothetical protein